jgi:NOL1/NOP2/fmu family ribosome biogenesis protein
MKPRANILADNLTKWGTMNTIVTNNDPKDFIRLSGLFDVIIIDAPSSGSGLFRKDPEAVKEWSEENVLLYAQRQKRIIDDAWGSLKQGGILIYSTSSYSPAENEEIATWICEEFDAKPLTFDYEGQTKQQFFRFYPDKMKGEGFFITALQKTSSEKEVFIRSGKPIKNNNRRTEREIFRHWVSDIDKHTWFEKNSEYFLVNPLHEHLIQRLDSILSLIKLGVKLGKIAVKELIPDHELAVSLHLTNEINTIEVSLEEALKYLRKDDFSLAETKKGWTLITFQGYSLGWAKVLPNRVNNYYPKELRIVSRENPENESK